MTKTTQAALKKLVNNAEAYDLTNAAPSQALREVIEPIAISRDRNDINGALFCGIHGGKLYAITARNSNLFFYF